MTGAGAFLGKELREILRTYKIYVIPAVFLAMGFLSPIMAKIAPEMVKSMAPAEGLIIRIPPAKPVDAYLQLFKNFNQLLVLVVIFSLIGLVAEEKVKGTAMLMLVKPVPRWVFILSKYTAGAVLVLGATVVSYAACLYYTVIIFHDAMFVVSAQALALLMGYYLLILAVTLFASTVGRSVASSGAVAVGGWILFAVLPAFGSWFAKYTPAALSGLQVEILKGTKTFAQAAPVLAGALGLAALFVAASVLIFRRQEL